MDEGPLCCLAFSLLDNISIPFLILSLLIIVLLLLLSALISGSEVAFFSLSEEEIKSALVERFGKNERAEAMVDAMFSW